MKDDPNIRFKRLKSVWNCFCRFFCMMMITIFVGFIIFAASAETEPPILPAIGAILVLLSPFISIVLVWQWNARDKRKRAEKDLECERQQADYLERIKVSEQDVLRRRFIERQRLIDSVDRHRSALTRNINRAIKKNDYGAVVEDKRFDAFNEFFASISLDMKVMNLDEAIEIVLEQLDIREEEDRDKGFESDNLPTDGHVFEKWVADALNSFGWSAEVTIATGDQGIDVIAEYNGKKIGLQCKLYSNPIGNKAVQEAHAGKQYYGVDAVGVLSNATYTLSAKELAAVTGVLLLSHHDIPTLHEYVFSK